MPEPHDDDKTRLVEIDAVLDQLERLKDDAVKMIVSLQKERDRAHAKQSNNQEQR